MHITGVQPPGSVKQVLILAGDPFTLLPVRSPLTLRFQW